MVAEDDETSKDKEIDKLMALISLSIDNVTGARKTVGSTVVKKSGIQCYNCKEFRHVARECQKPKRVKDAAYHREKMLLCKQEEGGIQLNAEQAHWRDETDDDELEDQELEAHYMYMAQLQEVFPDAADSGPIFDDEPLQKVSNDDHYNVFAMESKHPEQFEYVLDTYPIEQDAHNVIIDSLDISYEREQIDQNYDDNDLANERELLASLIEKLKCKIDESKNRNKFLETSNKVLIEKLKGEIKEFKNKNKSLELSNNRFKEANNKLSETNNLLYTDYKKSEAELARHNSMEYVSKIEIECAKVRGDFLSYKMNSQKSSNKYTQTINDLNQMISEMKDKLSAHQETISILSQQKEAQIKLYKTREDKELDKVIALENKVKVLDNIVYKIGQSVQTMNMLNKKCRTSFIKPEFLKKAQRANPRLRINAGLAQFHKCLNEEMIADLRYFNSLELEVDSLRSQLETQKTQFLNETDRLSREYYYADHMNAIRGVYTELDKYFEIQDLKAQLQDKSIVISELKKLIEKLKGESVDTKFEKSSVIRQPNAFKSQRPSVLGKPTTFSNSFERKDFSKSKFVTQNNVSNDFSKPVTAQTLPLNKKSIVKNTNVLASGMYKLHTDHLQARTSQLPQDSRKTNKRVSFSTGVIPTTSVSRPQLKSNPMGDRVMRNNSQGKKQEVEDQRRNVKLTKNKTFVTACNDSLKAKTLNVNSVSAMCDKCVLNNKHDMCNLNSVAKPLKKTVASESNQKPRNITRKLYKRVSKTCSWWYPKFTPSGYKWKPKSGKENVNPNHMTGNLKLLINFVEKFLGTLKFGNDQIAPILRYRDLVQRAVTIKRVYYVEGLNHNLFSVGQLCDADLEVAFRKSTCYIRDLKGNDLLKSSCGTDLYSITLQDTNCPNPICLMAKATSSQEWLWHRRLSHLNFDTINLLLKNDIVTLHAHFATEGILHQTDGENLDKMKEKGDAYIFVGYSTQSRAYRVFNKRTRVIMESIHVNFDELPHMASDHISSDPAPKCQRMALEHDSLSLRIQYQENVPQADRTVTTSNELDLLFSLMFDELLNGSSKVVLKSSAVSTVDAPNQRQHHTTPLNTHTTPAPTCHDPTLAPTITSTENMNQAKTYAENDQVADDEFINIFCTPVQD
nr:integrase, catalytic region, zinc finger, CCHC-type, peptidase aspartic, catalytic [Tanacetum cinerariifolium]